MPWINLMFAASIVLTGLLLRHGRWNSWLRMGDVMLGFYTLVLLLQIVATGDILVSAGVSTVLELGLAVATVVTGFEVAGQVWRLAKSARHGVPPIGEGMSVV